MEAVEVEDGEAAVTVVEGCVVAERATVVEGSVLAGDGQRNATMTMTPTAMTSMAAVMAKRHLHVPFGRLPVPSVSNPCPFPHDAGYPEHTQSTLSAGLGVCGPP